MWALRVQIFGGLRGRGYNVSCSLGDVEEIGIHNWRRDKDLPKSRGRGAVNIFKCVTVDLASICIITE